MAKIVRKIEDRIEVFRAAWREMAPDAVFCEMTYAQFVEASEPSLLVRREVLGMERQLDGKRAERSLTDGTAATMLNLIVNSVRGTSGYGEDSPLYRAFGFVRKSDRKSGLTHKKVNKTDEASAD